MSNVNITVNLELRLHNGVFLCRLDGKWHNKENEKLMVIAGIEHASIGPDGKTQVALGAIIVCENCYKENSGNKGLGFKEPSGIVTPEPGDVNAFSKRN